MARPKKRKKVDTAFTGRTEAILWDLRNVPWKEIRECWMVWTGTIRATTPGGFEYCPLTLAASRKAQEPESYYIWDHENAGRDLGMTSAQACLVADAADNNTHPLRDRLKQLLGMAA